VHRSGSKTLGGKQKARSVVSQTQAQVVGSTLKFAGHLMSGQSQVHDVGSILFGALQPGLA
jgi:hypothetical protein